VIEARDEPMFTAAGVAAATGASLIGEPSARVESIVADSREAGPFALFVALPGARVDGHSFIEAALREGTSCILARSDQRSSVEAASSALAKQAGAALLFVPDTLSALQSLARAYRARYPNLLRIGVTGSSGKTTTKECIASILGRSRSIIVNHGNLNSDIGLPLSIFAITKAHEVGIFEMGMSRLGEMNELASVLEPDVALITNVGIAHVGVLGSRDAIAGEKKAIFSRFDGRQAGFVWEDDDYNAFLKSGVRGDVADFGPRSTIRLSVARDRGLEGYDLSWDGIAFHYPLPGRHNLLDAVGAAATASRAGASASDVAEGLSSVRPLFGRSEVLRGEFTIVRDCYNANPDSMAAAIRLCDSVDWAGRRAYVLGSMLELGPESEAAHRTMGEIAGRSEADALFFFGEETRSAFDAARLAGFRGLMIFETDFERLLAAIRGYIAPGDLALIKASRSMALERLAEALATGRSRTTESSRVLGEASDVP
jgi:UDP-N-acetylmuramoyl-tripeptide--D-alanyl-D-alanine ligase